MFNKHLAILLNTLDDRIYDHRILTASAYHSFTRQSFHCGKQIANFGAGSGGEVEQRSASTGTHHPARQRVAALPADGSGAGHIAQSTGLAP